MSKPVKMTRDLQPLVNLCSLLGMPRIAIAKEVGITTQAIGYHLHLKFNSSDWTDLAECFIKHNKTMFPMIQDMLIILASQPKPQQDYPLTPLDFTKLVIKATAAGKVNDSLDLIEFYLSYYADTPEATINRKALVLQAAPQTLKTPASTTGLSTFARLLQESKHRDLDLPTTLGAPTTTFDNDEVSYTMDQFEAEEDQDTLDDQMLRDWPASVASKLIMQKRIDRGFDHIKDTPEYQKHFSPLPHMPSQAPESSAAANS